jgi:hypothetical protein
MARSAEKGAARTAIPDHFGYARSEHYAAYVNIPFGPLRALERVARRATDPGDDHRNILGLTGSRPARCGHGQRVGTLGS